MDAHSLHVLEFDKVRELLASHAASEIGRRFALEAEPLVYYSTVTARLQETREARDLRDAGSAFPLAGIQDVGGAADRARLGTRLTPREMLDVMRTAAAGRQMRGFVVSRREKAPALASIATELPILQALEDRIEHAISPTAEVRDSASSLLASLRTEARQLQHRLQDRLQSILGSERVRSYIQEAVITVREGRYCIPVKAEFARAFGGIVHDSSQSGATLFLEPAETVDTGNRIKQAQIEAEREVGRILDEVSELIGVNADALHKSLSILGHLDLVHARALLAEAMRATEPIINRGGTIRLRRARHPLLTGDVVPIDVEVGDRFTTLLITGPNTGGKTVTLKTLGLLSLMAMSGMQIPAGEESEIALWDGIFADIGDEQDIRQSLSTFSAHLKNIARILDNMDGQTLVLLDEVGAGTDPTEGAALATALLEHFRRRGARTVATTHYGSLKEYAYATPGVENASVEFDPERLAPTYRLLTGVPGSSNAFSIAARLGLSGEILAAAREALTGQERDAGDLLMRLEQSRRAAAQMEVEAARLRDEAVQAHDELALRVAEINETRRTIRGRAEEEARLILARAEERAENIIGELRRVNRGAQKGTTSRRRLQAVRTETFHELRQNGEETEEPPPLPTSHVWKAGDTARIPALNADGTLIEAPRDGVAPVQVGAMRVSLPVAQLRPVRQGAAAPAVRKQPQSTGAAEIANRKAMHIAPELMLRALRVEEAQPMLDRYMDDAFAAGLQSVRIVHGKGTGTMRRVVWEFLQGHPAVESFRMAEQEEGGDGATVVTLKK